MEEGIVVRLKKEKKFCFIEREGKPDLHCSTRFIPDVEEGDRVSFEEEQGTRGPTARKVRILSRADGTQYVPGQKTGQPQETKVGIEFGEPHPWTRKPFTVKKPGMGLPTWIVLGRSNLEVKLVEVDGQSMDETATTTSDGKAFFRPVLPAGTTNCQIKVMVDSKPYNFFWPTPSNEKQKVSKSNKGCKAIQAEVVMGEPGYLNTLVVRTLTDSEDGSGVSVELSVKSATGQKFRVGGGVADTLTFKTNDKGHGRLPIFFAAGYRGDVIVNSIENPDIHTEPLYVRHPE